MAHTTHSSPRSYRAAMAALTTAQKSGAGVPAYLRWVNRPLGKRLAAVAFVLRMSPAAVTGISGLVSLAGVLLLAVAPPNEGTALGVTALLLGGYALDSADGQLARLTQSGSVAGEWLDHVVDAARLPSVHLGVAVSLARRGTPAADWASLVAVSFMVLVSAWFFGQILAEKLGRDGQGRPGASAPTWVSWAKLPYDVGFLYMMMLLLPFVDVFLILYVGLFLLNLSVAAASMRRKYRSLVETAQWTASGDGIDHGG